MNKKVKNLLISLLMIIVCCIYTILVVTVDVKPIGPEYSKVGFSTINNFFVNILGSNMIIYKISEYLGYIALLYLGVYALIGFIQLIKRKSLKKVDPEIYVLACFYVLVLGVYLLFELLVINYRPILMDGALDPSFPSSHTILAICFCGSSIIINNLLFKKVKGIKLVNCFSLLLMFAITITRLISGVHWFSDIVGGLLISLCLLQIFNTALLLISKKKINISFVKVLITILVFILVAGLGIFIKDRFTARLYNNCSKDVLKYNKDGLPYPQVTGGVRGELGIDKNINEQSIDNYLGRDDSVYRDMRMLEDPASYESIGGNRFLDGYVKGFEVVSLPYIIPVDSLPDEVGNTYQGLTLFGVDDKGNYYPRFNESMSIIEELFPKDKYIFLMCGGGGYAGMMKSFLVSLGWEYNNIWVVGGYWYYSGENDIKVPFNNGKYDFSKVPYHEINFNKLTTTHSKDKNKVTLSARYYDTFLNEEYINIYKSYYDLIDEGYSENEAAEKQEEIYKAQGEYINSLVDKKESFILAYLDYAEECSEDTKLNDIVNYTVYQHKVYIYSLDPNVYKYTNFKKEYPYIPGILIIKEGKVVAYFDGNDDFTIELRDGFVSGNNNDLLYNWLGKYINF